MTKMATMPLYGKNLKKSSSLEPKGQWPWILVCIIGCLSTTNFAQLMTLGWPWHILRQGQIWSLMLLYGKKVKQWIFQKLLSSMIWNWQQMSEVTRSFCWHHNFVPWGLYAPALGHNLGCYLSLFHMPLNCFPLCYQNVHYVTVNIIIATTWCWCTYKTVGVRNK